MTILETRPVIERPRTGTLIEQFELGLDAPICLTWELTYACNLECAHCLSSSGRRDPRELSTDQCKANSLVTGGGLYDDGILGDFSPAHGIHDHVIGNAGLDGAAYIQPFIFDKNPGGVFGDDPVELNDGGISDGIENILIDHNLTSPTQ